MIIAAQCIDFEPKNCTITEKDHKGNTMSVALPRGYIWKTVIIFLNNSTLAS